jgi:hypothetical protein
MRHTSADLPALARAAGLAGEEWFAWTGSDAVQAIVNASDDVHAEPIEAAFNDGVRERRLTVDGWRVAWTTAPEDYDTYGTETIEVCGPYHGKTLRKVLVDPRRATYQFDRYGSGLHPTWDEDPRETDRKIAERIAADKAEREVREAKRADGIAWLQTLDAAAIDDDSSEAFDTFESRGVGYTEVRAERARRAKAAADAERAATWARIRATIPDGATIVDDGAPGERGVYGLIPGRDPCVWRDVRIVPSYDDPDKGEVRDESGEDVGSPLLVADYLASGRLRLTRDGEIFPPRAVVLRAGGWSRLREIRRVEAVGKVVWVTRAMFASDFMVLDDAGHLVRSKKVAETAAAIAAKGGVA